MYPVDAIKVSARRNENGIPQHGWLTMAPSTPQTRMQIINPTPSAVYNGMIQGTYRIASGEGILSLWRGMSSVVVGAGTSSPRRSSFRACPDFALLTRPPPLQVPHTPSTLRRTRPSSTSWAGTRRANTIRLPQVRPMAVEVGSGRCTGDCTLSGAALLTSSLPHSVQRRMRYHCQRCPDEPL